MANEHIIAELQALKAEPGFQMRWQETVQRVIDELSPPPPPVAAAPPPPPPEPIVEKVEEEAPKPKVTHAAHAAPKVTHAAHTAPAKTKGK
jgi:hypothetical protein